MKQKLEIQLKKFLRFWLPVISWGLVIFLFSSKPTGRASEIHWQDFIFKKTAHVLIFGLFAILLYRAIRQEKVENKNAGLLSIFLTFAYGVTDEFHQSFTPGREPTFRDIIFDTIGAILAIYLIWNLLPSLPSRLRRLAKDLQLL